MWYKYLLVLLVSFFAFSFYVDADLCDREHINQLKELAKQIEVDYEYIDESDSGKEEYAINIYQISLNLLSNDLYLVHNENNYYYDQFENGNVNFNVNSGKQELVIYSTLCPNIKIKTIKLNLLKFNVFSKYDECAKVADYDLDVCDPWYQGYLDEISFYDVVDKYLIDTSVEDETKIDINFDSIINFIKTYYMYFICGLIGLTFIIVSIIVIINKKRSVLE